MTAPLVWWIPDDLMQSTAGFPEYLKTEVASRRGRAGRGRLWVDRQFGRIAIDPWPETPLADWIGRYAGGIVIRPEEADIVRHASGLVTDLSLNQLFICAGGTLTAHEALDIFKDFQ